MIVLNCYASAGEIVFENAHHLGMMTSGWVWVVTDGITGFVSTLIILLTKMMLYVQTLNSSNTWHYLQQLFVL